MPHVTPGCVATSDAESDPPAAASTPRKHARVLITENQVGFSTMAGG
jgi:hypothetical protein